MRVPGDRRLSRNGRSFRPVAHLASPWDALGRVLRPVEAAFSFRSVPKDVFMNPLKLAASTRLRRKAAGLKTSLGPKPAKIAKTAKTAKLVFHIGHHKTGSSSIQRALACGDIALEGKSLLYPCDVSHNYLKRHFAKCAQGEEPLAGSEGMPGLKRIQKRVQEREWDYVVISGEEFEDSPASEVNDVLQRFLLPLVRDHMVLCYLRPHVPRVLSNYSEKVKIGQFPGTLEQFHKANLNKGRFLYDAKMAKWRAEFGEKLALRAMVRGRLRDGSVVQDFVQEAFGADAATASITPRKDSNESLCLEELMILSLVQEQLRDRDRHLRLMMGWEVARLMGEESLRKTRTKPALHRSLAETIRRDYLEDARAVDRAYFADDPIFEAELERAVDEAIPEPRSYRPEDYFEPDTLATIKVMTRLVDEMIDNDKGNWANFLRKVRYRAVLADK